MGNLYTIGHSTIKVEDFINLLKKFHIDYLLDVRSIPYSKYAEQFNREKLDRELTTARINYRFMGTYFGARQKDINLYHKDGYLDFDKVRSSKEFIKRVDSVISGLEKNNIVLMCTEKDPFDCHRAIMVGRAFDLRGITLNHILHSGTLQSQAELNMRLLHHYFPVINESSLFDDESELSDDKRLSIAYQRRNAEIGYHLDTIDHKEG